MYTHFFYLMYVHEHYNTVVVCVEALQHVRGVVADTGAHIVTGTRGGDNDDDDGSGDCVCER